MSERYEIASYRSLIVGTNAGVLRSPLRLCSPHLLSRSTRRRRQPIVSRWQHRRMFSFLPCAFHIFVIFQRVSTTPVARDTSAPAEKCAVRFVFNRISFIDSCIRSILCRPGAELLAVSLPLQRPHLLQPHGTAMVYIRGIFLTCDIAVQGLATDVQVRA